MPKRVTVHLKLRQWKGPRQLKCMTQPNERNLKVYGKRALQLTSNTPLSTQVHGKSGQECRAPKQHGKQIGGKGGGRGGGGGGCHGPLKGARAMHRAWPCSQRSVLVAVDVPIP
eukprot:6207020-Pleurochrysis_carterae.AAC.1